MQIKSQYIDSNNNYIKYRTIQCIKLYFVSWYIRQEVLYFMYEIIGIFRTIPCMQSCEYLHAGISWSNYSEAINGILEIT